MKSPIQSLEIVYLVHATEDPEKLGRAVATLIQSDAVPQTEKLQGHFGNEITKVTLHLTGDSATTAFQRILGAIPDPVRKEISSNIHAHLDEHSALFLRLDKQSLASGKITLGSGDSVRLKVKPRIYALKTPADTFYRTQMEVS